MATIVKVWQSSGKQLTELSSVSGTDGFLEKQVEEWVKAHPELIDPSILIIGQQIQTASGPLDLLGIDEDGMLVVIELKRDKTPREVVAQALDYAAWVDTLSEEEIQNIAQDYLGKPLEDAMQEKFGRVPESINAGQHILVVAQRLDDSTERMIAYLSERYSISINGVLFTCFKVADGSLIVVRTMVVEDEIESGHKGGGQRRKWLTDGRNWHMSKCDIARQHLLEKVEQYFSKLGFSIKWNQKLYVKFFSPAPSSKEMRLYVGKTYLDLVLMHAPEADASTVLSKASKDLQVISPYWYEQNSVGIRVKSATDLDQDLLDALSGWFSQAEK